MVFHDKARNERKKLYFDLICGTVFSIFALIGIIFINTIREIANTVGWFIGLTFFISYLILSLFLVCYGLYSKWQENHIDEKEPRKDLKPPIL